MNWIFRIQINSILLFVAVMFKLLLMKNYSSRSIIVLFFVIQFTESFSQTDFTKGYIISLNGDATFGLLSLRGDGEMSKICVFKSTKDEKIQTYTPNDIYAYRIENGKFYVSKEVRALEKDSLVRPNPSKVFMEFLIKGKLNVFYYWDEKGEHYFVQKEGEEMTELLL